MPPAGKGLKATPLQGAFSLDGRCLALLQGDTLTLYGRAQLLAGQVEASEKTLEQATAVLPVEPSAFFYLSDAAKRRGHTSASREALAKYASLTGDDVSLDPARRAVRPREN